LGLPMVASVVELLALLAILDHLRPFRWRQFGGWQSPVDGTPAVLAESNVCCDQHRRRNQQCSLHYSPPHFTSSPLAPVRPAGGWPVTVPARSFRSASMPFRLGFACAPIRRAG